MGILDEAIREHLELKRQHGAAESELKELEDEAFGQSGRPGEEESPPDALSEAPTEFMVQPEGAEAAQGAEEEPEVGGEQAPEPSSEQAHRRREPAPEIAALQEGPGEPAVEESPAMEHEAIRPADADAKEEAPPEVEVEEMSPGPSTEERQVLSEQPTELYDVEGEEFGSTAAPAPSEDELVEEELSEPRLAPVDAVIDDVDEAAEVEDDDEDDFFDEKRLSDELNQALEAPSEADREDTEPDEAAGDEEPSHTGPDEDLLEETPDFLEETPEDDELWFEQKPPKDFDFDD